MRQIISFLWIIPFLVFENGYAQESMEKVLEEYVLIGIQNNQALKQKNFSYQKSSAALKEARGMFMPSISIEARYSRAGGGREIIFPVGDLMNPVYGSLNQLFAATGLPQQNFPTLENEQIPFLRKEEHETKLRLVQPLIQPAIYYNYQLKDNLSEASMSEVRAYKSQLISEIKSAYYKYMQTIQLVTLFEGTLDLLNENIRVSQALYDNDMVTIDVIYRAGSEKLKVDQQLEEAKHKNILAKSYFNFLLNRPLDEDILISENNESPLYPVINLNTSEERALKHRDEIRQIEHALSATENAHALSGSGYFPNLNLVMDYGFQGAEYNFSKENDYWMASAVLSWNLFNGFQDNAKREQAAMDNKIMQARSNELRKQIRMQVKNAVWGLQVSHKTLLSAQKQETQANESFKIVSTKYKEGVASQIEFIDARLNMTNSRINNIISKYDFFIKQAELDHVLGNSN
ncbi:MAG: TolC family protein [Calditrichaeota bacterium]|nr:TolC family protein [Calditrichota bacterium]